jgi:hypothetical protein
VFSIHASTVWQLRSGSPSRNVSPLLSVQWE